MYNIARHAEGCSLNPIEYVLGDDQKPRQFPTKEAARDFYLEAGGHPDDINDDGPVFITKEGE